MRLKNTILLLFAFLLVTGFLGTTTIRNLSGWEEKENTIQTISNKTVNITGGRLVVENITSPHANESTIFFMTDGSIGVILDPK